MNIAWYCKKEKNSNEYVQEGGVHRQSAFYMYFANKDGMAVSMFKTILHSQGIEI